ncbi:MAG: glycerol dehydrogenase [Pseudomonadota bacterium]
MATAPVYYPHTIFATRDSPTPRVMVAPPRYIQGPGVLAQTGKYLSLISARRAVVLASARGHRAEAATVADSLAQHQIESLARVFNGECTLDEINQQVSELADQDIDCLLAVGGGKCVDAGKSIAHRLGVPVVIIPTLASNDAATSALSVLHTNEGVSMDAEFFPNNPAMVIMDTQVVAQAAERYIVAGMGDAMATWFEARVCLNNPRALSTVGARPTLASAAIGEVCASTLFSDGEAAADAVRNNTVTEALENVVEANTLLSGLGFESGGLAVAHGIANAYTAVHHVHADYLHGEMVAMGTLAQLVMEGSDDASRTAEFFCRIGLPIHLGHLSMKPTDDEDLARVVAAAIESGIVHNMPMAVTPESLRTAILEADALGREVSARLGDVAYQRLHKR